MTLRIVQGSYVALTGLLIILVSTFFASGGLGENFTDNPFPYPLWLLPIAVWAAGLSLVFKRKTIKYGLLICTLPVIFYAVLYFMALTALESY